MSEKTTCDVCGEGLDEIGPYRIRYAVQCRDEFGYLRSVDLCSPECLTTQAVRDAREQGTAAEHVALRTKLDSAPRKVQKWWNR